MKSCSQVSLWMGFVRKQECKNLETSPRFLEDVKCQSCNPLGTPNLSGIRGYPGCDFWEDNRAQMYWKCKTFRQIKKLFIGVLRTSVFFNCLFSRTSLFFPIETTSISHQETSTTKQAGQWRTLWLLLYQITKQQMSVNFHKQFPSASLIFLIAFLFQLNCAYHLDRKCNYCFSLGTFYKFNWVVRRNAIILTMWN